jgi:hypothetical protein
MTDNPKTLISKQNSYKFMSPVLKKNVVLFTTNADLWSGLDQLAGFSV